VFCSNSLSSALARLTGWIIIWCCTCRDWPFSSASKPIDLGLGFQVHWFHIKLGFPASSLVGALNGWKYREPSRKIRFFLFFFGGRIHKKLFARVDSRIT